MVALRRDWDAPFSNGLSPCRALQGPLASCPPAAMPPVPGPFGLTGNVQPQARKEIGVT